MTTTQEENSIISTNQPDTPTEIQTNGTDQTEGVPSPKGDVVLKVENVSKKFCRNLKRSMLYGIQDLAKGMVSVEPDTTTLRKDEFWALKDIDFELREGEILGIIGANGSGKSTLLRVLTGIFPPDKGRIWMDGTVGGIIALGAGMHPHMTGRENIYLNGTILGMSKEEIDGKFDEIVDFAEIGNFLDAPFNTYSSGMRVRLGFAVAIQCQPDILLVDEVLAVGDMNFRQKSMRKMSKILDSNKSIIFISHNTDQILQICNRCILVDKGNIIMDGKPSDVVYYYNEMQSRIDFDEPEVTGDSVKLDTVELNEENVNTSNVKVKSGEDLEFKLKFRVDSSITDVFVSFGFGISGRNLSIYNTNQKGSVQLDELNSDTELVLKIPEPHLPQGNYKLVIGVWDLYSTHCYYWNYKTVGEFYIQNSEVMYSDFMFSHSWEIHNS